MTPHAYYHDADADLQVSCMNDVCGLLPFRLRDVPDQFYRIWTSLFLHAGIFHLLITVVSQDLIIVIDYISHKIPIPVLADARP